LGFSVFSASSSSADSSRAFLQSSWIRRLFSRFKLDLNFIAIVTMILSVASVVFFTVSAITPPAFRSPGALPSRHQPQPAPDLSADRDARRGLLVSSHTKRFLFNRFLVNSGLNRSLSTRSRRSSATSCSSSASCGAYAIPGINLGALAVFAGAIGVGYRRRSAGIASNFISGPRYPRGAADLDRRPR
jgi:small-conductance mechanosensitive channel